MATEKDIAMQKKSNELTADAIKLQKDLLKQTKSLTKTLADATKNLGKFGESQEKVIDNFSDFSKEIKKFSGHQKNIKKLTESFDLMTNEVDELSEGLRKLDINSTKSMRNIRNSVVMTNKNFNKLMGQVKNIDKFKGSLDGLRSNLGKLNGMVGRAFDDSDLISMKDSLKDLKGIIPEKEFEKLKGLIDKTDFKNYDDFQNLVKRLNSQHIKSLKKNLMDISSSGSLKDLDEDTKNLIGNMIKLVNDPMASYEDLVKNLPGLQSALGKAFDVMSDKANQSAENLSKQYDEITKQTQLAKKEIEEALVIQANTDQVHKSINAIKDYVKSGTFELGGAGLFPDKAVENADNLEKIQKRLPLYEKALAENVEKISNLTEDEVDKRKKLEEINKKITAKIREQAKHAEELTEQTDKYLRIGEQIKKNPFGSDKVEKMEEGLFKAHFRLKELSNRGGKFSGVLGKVSEAAGTLGTKIKGIAFPVAVLSQVMSLGKYLLDIQSKFSGIAREIEGTGAFAIGGPDLDKNLSEAEGKMRNISGLMSRRFGGDAFALGREEIQGMVGAMDQAGIKASKLKDVFKDVNTTTAAQGNEFLKAADMAHVFAGAMGVSRQEVAGMMGDMFVNYTQNGKAIQESFAQIAAASQETTIGTNRFLGIVQTATAGMSLYERQVADTAIAIKNMTKNMNLTGKEAETAAKSANEFANDTHKVITAFAMMEKQAPGTMNKINSSVKDEIALLEKRKDLSVQEKQQLENMKKFTAAVDRGDTADAGALLKQLPQEAINKTVGTLVQQIEKMSGGSAFKKEELMQTMGLGKEMAVLSEKTGGAVGKALLGDIERGNKLFEKQAKDQDKRDDKTGDLNNKIISSLGEGLGSTVNTISNTLLAILSIIGGSQILKIGKSITGMMGGGGGGLISKAKSALGVGADVAEAGAKTGKMGKLGKMGSDLAGKIGKTKIGGGVLKGASKILKMGKAIPVLGSLVAAGFAAKDVWKIGEGLVEGKGVDKGALASLGMNALSMVPVVGTAAAIADVGLSASGVYDKLSAESVGSNNLKPSMPESPVITSRAAGSSSNTVASNVGGGGNGTVNISINGGDIQKVRAVVQQEVTKALGKTRTG